MLYHALKQFKIIHGGIDDVATGSILTQGSWVTAPGASNS